MKDLKQLVRENIWNLKPYSCARDEFKGEASVFLDANENPFYSGYNRYPDPRQLALKAKISKIKNIGAERIMLGIGSDEPIDLVYRIFCEPGIDNVVAMEPTYGMYGVCADINNVEYRRVPLNADYSLNAKAMLDAADGNTKVMWLCSPNNPTGNLMSRKDLHTLLKEFEGIVVIDEAYIDFSSETSWLTEIDSYPNLIVLQTFSKAWGMAGARCGMAFASTQIIELFNKVKYPYNINSLTQNIISERIDKIAEKESQVSLILEERSRLAKELAQSPIVECVYPSDANFLLVKVLDANKTYNALVSKGTIVRNRNTVKLCGNCLRITIGTKEENDILVQEFRRGCMMYNV